MTRSELIKFLKKTYLVRLSIEDFVIIGKAADVLLRKEKEIDLENEKIEVIISQGVLDLYINRLNLNNEKINLSVISQFIGEFFKPEEIKIIENLFPVLYEISGNIDDEEEDNLDE